MSVDTHQEFSRRGWMIVDLPDPTVVRATRDRLLAHLRSLLAVDLDRLESYHTVVGDDARHIDVLYELASRFWDEQLGIAIIRRNLPVFEQLVGLDLHVQTYPYLRVARPQRPQDVTGLHRDTYYGASPYEVAVLVPFTDMTRASAVHVISGSHVEPDSAYPFTQQQSRDVTMGSIKHRLGFPYAPRALDPALVGRAEPVPLAVGQALVFSLALVHGGLENTGDATRVSGDVRVVNSLAPVHRARGVRPDYYMALCRSPVSEQAEHYFEVNAPRPDEA